MEASQFAVVVVVVLVAWVIPLIVTALKGKRGLALAGILFHPCWWFGAIRLAKPESYWARRFYDSEKLHHAQTRFPQY